MAPAPKARRAHPLGQAWLLLQATGVRCKQSERHRRSRAEEHAAPPDCLARVYGAAVLHLYGRHVRLAAARRASLSDGERAGVRAHAVRAAGARDLRELQVLPRGLSSALGAPRAQHGLAHRTRLGRHGLHGLRRSMRCSASAWAHGSWGDMDAAHHGGDETCTSSRRP